MNVFSLNYCLIGDNFCQAFLPSVFTHLVVFFFALLILLCCWHTIIFQLEEYHASSVNLYWSMRHQSKLYLIYLLTFQVTFHIRSHQRLAQSCQDSDASSLYFLDLEKLTKCLLSHLVCITQSMRVIPTTKEGPNIFLLCASAFGLLSRFHFTAVLETLKWNRLLGMALHSIAILASRIERTLFFMHNFFSKTCKCTCFIKQE